MKLDEVPQDHSPTYGGHSKVVYAVDAEGRYQRAQRSGGEPDAFATQVGVPELEAQKAEAEPAWKRGELSPLKCLMYRYRLDEPALAQISGLWQWRIRRHFRPAIYRRLSAAILALYAVAFVLPVEQLIGYQKDPA